MWTRGHDKPVVERFHIANGDVGTIRAVLRKRDRGICAICGIDTIRAHASARRWATGAEEFNRAAERRQHYARLGFPPPTRQWWDADHTIPLAEGGTHALDNLRTLCVPCHRRETAALAARLAAKRREPVSPKLPGFTEAHRKTANLRSSGEAPRDLTPPRAPVLLRSF